MTATRSRGIRKPGAMHRWDSRLHPPQPGVHPTAWSEAVEAHRHETLRGPGWRRSSHGFYVPATEVLTPQQRITEAHAILRGRGAVGGWAAAHWRGAQLLDGRGPFGMTAEPVLLCLGHDRKLQRQNGIRLSRELLPSTDIVELRGIRCTGDLRTCFDGSRLAPNLIEAVVFLDMLLACRVVTLASLRTYVEEHAGWKGVQQARSALTLAAQGVMSPPETRLRLVWVLEARLPMPLVNRPVFDLDGRLLGYPDALDPDSGTVLEYDSDDHRELDRHTDDNIREELFEDHGLAVVRVTKLDLRRPHPPLVERLKRARERGLQRDRRRDRWTLRSPPSWPGSQRPG